MWDLGRLYLIFSLIVQVHSIRIGLVLKPSDIFLALKLLKPVPVDKQWKTKTFLDRKEEQKMHVNTSICYTSVNVQANFRYFCMCQSLGFESLQKCSCVQKIIMTNALKKHWNMFCRVLFLDSIADSQCFDILDWVWVLYNVNTETHITHTLLAGIIYFSDFVLDRLSPELCLLHKMKANLGWPTYHSMKRRTGSEYCGSNEVQ